jgi:hypothetical protein
VQNKSDLGFLPVICSVIYFALFSVSDMADQAYIVDVLSYQLLCLLRPSPPVSRSLLLLLGFLAKPLQQTALALDA